MGVNLDAERDRRLHSWMNGIPAPPLRVSIFPTNVCNLRCKMCGIPHGVDEGRFRVDDECTTEEWLPIIKEGAEMGILEWWICGGGEPLARRELTLDIIKTIKRYSPHSYTELTTNGTRFTEEMLRELVKIGHNKMQFSIDAPDAVTHDMIRGEKGTFKKATWAIRRFCELKEEMGVKAPWITINAVLNRKNYDRMEGFIDFAEEYGVEFVNVTPLRVTDEMRPTIMKAGLLLNNIQKRESFRSAERAMKLAKERGIGFEFEVNEEWEDISEHDINTKFVGEEVVGPLDPSKKRSHPSLPRPPVL